jgi:hypothetical protein
MRLPISIFLFAVMTLAGGLVHAADDAQTTATVAPELEAKFKATMTETVMSGRFLPVKDGVIGAEKEDKYSIVSAEKVSGNSWVINARMRNMVIPIPVKVVWAGDTAVIIVDNLQIPGAGNYGGSAYSARVMVYGDSYAGTWSGGGHGGLLSGVIAKSPGGAGDPGGK